jgi:outer membrane protein OmpA-like peptidoglycan-associated protein
MQMTIMKTMLLSSFLLLRLAGFSQNKESFTVHFHFNKYDLTTAATASLDSFVNAAKTKGNILNIQLNGHCDAIGNDAYNDRLSRQRVNAVKNYLLKNNVDKNNFSVAEGHGKREPLNDNTTAQKRLLNRRVEIIVGEEEMKVEEVKVEETKVEEMKIDEQIEKTGANNTFVLKNLNFVGARHQLLPGSLPILEELLGVMKKNKALKIEIQGHICCLPGNVDGFDEETGTNNLSELRAKAVWEYLIKNGIEESRVSYKGFGHNQPLFAYPEKTELEKTLNRRVEIKILSK